MRSRRGFLLSFAGLPVGLAAEAVLPRESISSLERRVFNAINFQRVSGDAGPLVWSQALGAASRAHSERMLKAGFFGHEDPVYGDLAARMAAAGVEYARCGENVFREKDFNDPVALAVVEWMYSEGHRRNIMRPEFTLTGVGVAIDADGTVAVTQEFLTPPPAPQRRRTFVFEP